MCTPEEKKCDEHCEGCAYCTEALPEPAPVPETSETTGAFDAACKRINISGGETDTGQSIPELDAVDLAYIVDDLREAHNADMQALRAELEVKNQWYVDYGNAKDKAVANEIQRANDAEMHIVWLEAELSDLREDADDLRVLTEQLVHEPCEDAVHCSCVPLLRKKIKELEAQISVASSALDELSKLGNGPIRGNSIGNCIAIEALEKLNLEGLK